MAEDYSFQTALIAGILTVLLLLNLLFTNSLQSDISELESNIASKDAEIATNSAQLEALYELASNQ
ncbi:MAG: hypothetical protein VX837_01420, partial [Candidatus Thermoplasmatota archaeon]|nr:hypothetical protein [Candidatus Thermoplasmatota archaeon]